MVIEADATDKAIVTNEVHKADEAIKPIELPLDGTVANTNNKVHLVDEANKVNKIIVANEFIEIVVVNEANIIDKIVVANANNNKIDKIAAASEAIWFCHCCCCWYRRRR